MAGIYLHIPFCHQACYYCDFHFSTFHKLIPEVISAINMELKIRKDYLSGAAVESIYFGGGTPSLLNVKDLQQLLELIYKFFPVMDACEISLEANPDDLHKNKLKGLKSIGINRLSIGAQSFNDEILSYLHRAHTAKDTRKAFLLARETGFENISLDLIYAIRENHLDILNKDLEEIIKLKPEHISAYSLTIEPSTVFGRWLKKNRIMQVPDHQSAEQFEIISKELTRQHYDHYEISNYAQPGFLSIHNTNYWQDKPYLGVGPSAHSYNLEYRQYNIDNNSLYIKSLKNGEIPATMDYLSQWDRINERILTGLRTRWGCDLEGIKNEFGVDILGNNRGYIEKLVDDEMIILAGRILRLNDKGKLFADKIASDLFVTD